MPEALDFLLFDVCVVLGICLPPADIARICAQEFWEVESFTRQALRVEGLNPDEHFDLNQQISKRFTDMFGSNQMDRESFQKRQQLESEARDLPHE